MTIEDIEPVLEKARRNADGSYRVLASRLLAGKDSGRLPVLRHAAGRPE